MSYEKIKTSYFLTQSQLLISTLILSSHPVFSNLFVFGRFFFFFMFSCWLCILLWFLNLICFLSLLRVQYLRCSHCYLQSVLHDSGHSVCDLFFWKRTRLPAPTCRDVLCLCRLDMIVLFFLLFLSLKYL